jgi:hypothetical protein
MRILVKLDVLGSRLQRSSCEVKTPILTGEEEKIRESILKKVGGLKSYCSDRVIEHVQSILLDYPKLSEYYIAVTTKARGNFWTFDMGWKWVPQSGEMVEYSSGVIPLGQNEHRRVRGEILRVLDRHLVIQGPSGGEILKKRSEVIRV